MSETPEWFRLTADHQNPISERRKPFGKGFKFSVFAVPLVLIGVVGAIALGSKEVPKDKILASSANTPIVNTVANSDLAKLNIATKEVISTPSNPAQSNGFGVSMPITNGEPEDNPFKEGFINHVDDEDEDEDEDDEFEGRERHREKREH